MASIKLPPQNQSLPRFARETYSHDQMSFGFWAGDDEVNDAMYYAYMYPSPNTIDQTALIPKEAFWQEANGSPMALLKYEDVQKSANPSQMVLDFFESFYQKGAKVANWDQLHLKVPNLEDI